MFILYLTKKPTKKRSSTVIEHETKPNEAEIKHDSPPSPSSPASTAAIEYTSTTSIDADKRHFVVVISAGVYIQERDELIGRRRVDVQSRDSILTSRVDVVAIVFARRRRIDWPTANRRRE